MITSFVVERSWKIFCSILKRNAFARMVMKIIQLCFFEEDIALVYLLDKRKEMQLFGNKVFLWNPECGAAAHVREKK